MDQSENKTANKTAITTKKQKGGLMTFRQFFFLCLSKWKWFVASVVVCATLMVLYLVHAEPVYNRTAQVMIRDDNGLSGMGGDLGGMAADLGLLKMNSGVENEIIAMKSPFNILEVVRKLHLDITYVKAGFKKQTLYGDSLPVMVKFEGVKPAETAAMRMDLKRDGTFRLYKFKKKKEKYDGEVSGKVNSTVSSPIGKITVTAFPEAMKRMTEDYTIKITKITENKARENCMKIMDIELESRDGSVIDISYKDVSIERANDFINTVIDTYKEKWLKDKMTVAESNSHFINEHIGIIEQQLGLAEDDVTSLRTKYQLPEFSESSAAQILMEKASSLESAVSSLNNQLVMMRYLRDFANDSKHKMELLPSDLITEDAALSAQIEQYNSYILSRNRMVMNSSENAPMVQDHEKQIEALRRSILSAVDNRISQLRITLANTQRRSNEISGQVAQAPAKARKIVTSERQQKVLENVYLFLLKKREETQMSEMFGGENTRLISPPIGDDKPTSPRKLRMLAFSMLMGVFFPACWLYMRRWLRLFFRKEGRMPAE